MQRKNLSIQMVFVFALFALGLSFSLNHCNRATLCSGEVGDTGRNPDQQSCAVKCECNNQRYTGDCVQGVCRSRPRQPCDTLGAVRSCSPLMEECAQGKQICFPDELITRMWGDCRCVESQDEGVGEPSPEKAIPTEPVAGQDASETSTEGSSSQEKTLLDEVTAPGCVCSDCSFYRHLRKVQGDNQDLTTTAIHPETQTLALLLRNPRNRSQQQTIRLVDLQTGQTKREISFSGYYLCQRMKFLPNGKSILVLVNREVHMWDVKTGRLQHIYAGQHNQPINSFTISHDSNFLFTTSMAIHMWSLKSHQLVNTFTVHPTGASEIATDPNGRLVASRSGATILVWEIETSKIRYTFKGVSSSSRLVFSPDGVWLAVSGDSSTLWNLTTGTKVTVPVPPSYNVPVSFQRNSNILAIATQEGVYVWDRGRNQTLLTLKQTYTEISTLAFYNNDTSLVAVESGKYVSDWAIPSGTLRESRSFRKQGHLDTIATLEYSPKGDQLVTSSLDATALLWNTSTGQLQHTLLHTTSNVLGATFLKPKDTLVTFGVHLHLWEPKSGKRLKTLPTSNASGGRLVARPNTDIVASTKGVDIELWDVQKASRLRILSGHENSPRLLAFDPTGKHLASSYPLEKKVLLWDPDRGLIQHKISLTQPVYAIDFSPDGTQLAIGLGDGSTHLWDVKQQTTIHVFRTQPTGKTTSCVDFHPSGRMLMTCNHDILLWDLRSKQLLQTLRQEGVIFSKSQFHPHHNRITSTSLRDIHVWTCQ